MAVAPDKKPKQKPTGCVVMALALPVVGLLVALLR
jgi:hypothetical protein